MKTTLTHRLLSCIVVTAGTAWLVFIESGRVLLKISSMTPEALAEHERVVFSHSYLGLYVMLLFFGLLFVLAVECVAVLIRNLDETVRTPDNPQVGPALGGTPPEEEPRH